MVTHERDVSRIADRVVTLADGRVVDNQRMPTRQAAQTQAECHA